MKNIKNITQLAIKDLKSEADLKTDYALAKALNVSQSSIGRYSNGTTSITLEKLEYEVQTIAWTENTLLSLGGIQMKECLKVRGKIKDFKFLDQRVLEVVPDFYHRVNYAVAYIVDRAMANNLIHYHHPIRKADDWSYLFDFNDKSNILMTYLVDHPKIEIGEENLQLSAIEAERVVSKDIPQSKYGSSLRKNLAKLSNKRYFE